MTAPTILKTKTLNAETGKMEFSTYIITTPNAAAFATELDYADIAPAGVTDKQLYITCWGNRFDRQATIAGSHHMFIESPGGSGVWKLFLFTPDYQGPRTDHFNPPQVFTTADELCLGDFAGPPYTGTAIGCSFCIMGYYIP